MKAVIVGTGRCGTGYMSTVITKAGVPCGHESVFTPTGRNDTDLAADASWLALPHLEQLRFEGVPIILIYRHPLAVIGSFMGIEFFTGDGHEEYREFMYAVEPEMMALDPLQQACYHYWNWNTRAMAYADIIGDIDNPPWPNIMDVLGLEWEHLSFALNGTSPTINHRNRRDIDPALLPAQVWGTWEMLKERST